MIFVLSSHARISGDRGASQTSPPISGADSVNGRSRRGAKRGVPASAILTFCTVLKGTAAAAAARSDRGWCEPGDTRSGPDHPRAAGRTAFRPDQKSGRVRPSRTGSRNQTERVAPPGNRRGQGGWYRGAAAGAPRPSGEAALAGPEIPDPGGASTRERPPTCRALTI